MGRSHHRDRSGGGGAATVVLSSFPSPSPSSSSSSSDFEFTVSLSPTSRRSSQQCPADELFYKGKLLPLHLSPRISMVRTLLLASSSTSSDSTATTASRDSTASSSSTSSSDLPDPDSSRPSSAAEDDLKRPRRPNYFSSFATRFSSVFRKQEPDTLPLPTKKTTTTTKQVIKKYVKKMKPIYERLSSKQTAQGSQNLQNQQNQQNQKKTFSFSIRRDRSVPVKKEAMHSFSGNLRYPKRNRCAGSCPSSMRSSPTHSGVLYAKPLDEMQRSGSSMEDLQGAIQGAIAHCKSTMGQSKVR